MLPSFCAAGYTYGVEIIIELLSRAVEIDSAKRAAAEWRQRIGGVSRRQVALYMNRISKNRSLIQYGINQISPENANIGSSPGDTEWTKRFLLGIKPTTSPEFNDKFHKATGLSFMSLQNRIA